MKRNLHRTLLPSYCFTKWKKTRLFTNCLEMFTNAKSSQRFTNLWLFLAFSEFTSHLSHEIMGTSIKWSTGPPNPIYGEIRGDLEIKIIWVKDDPTIVVHLIGRMFSYWDLPFKCVLCSDKTYCWDIILWHEIGWG